MRYIVRFRKHNSNWDATIFVSKAEADSFARRLQDAGYDAIVAVVPQWDKTDMVFGDPNYHHDIFLYS